MAQLSSVLSLRPSQKLAVESRGTNVVVVAGAGAGKTRVLVERYLSLLELGYALPSIVAITFTEKAAREMRDRVRREIERRTAPTTPRDTSKWTRYLEEIDSARIGTIHSLCAALLRANPVEAAVDPQFAILDEEDAALWRDQAIDATLAELAERGGDALALLRDYEIKPLREALRNLLQLGHAAQEAFDKLPPTPGELLADWAGRLERAQQQALARVLSNPGFCKAADWIMQNAATDSEDKLEKVRAEFADCLGRARGGDLFEAVAALRRIAQAKIGNVGGRKDWVDVIAARENIFSLRFLARDFADKYDMVIGDADRHAAELVFLWRTLWNAVRARYLRRKTAERVLDFDDLEGQARALLVEHPEVRERYHAEFACLLVDEFQDTNATQRDLIYSLAAPSEPDRLFIVADGKQSIYGFRGADVSVLTETTHDIVARWGPKARILLEESFRAHDGLIKTFNYIFSRIFSVDGSPAPFEIAYEPMVAPRSSRASGALVEIVQIPGETTEHGKLSGGQRREWEAQELAARIKQMVDESFPIWDKERQSDRSIRWGDLAMLFRSSTFMSAYEEALKAARIPYVAFAGKGYYDRAEVRDLVQLLRALDEPDDDLALAAVLRSPLYALSDETLFRLRSPGGHLRETIAVPPPDITGKERERVEFACESLSRLWARVGRVTILDLLKSSLEETDLLATVTALEDGERRRRNIEKLLSLARRTARVRLAEFIGYLQDLTAQEIREGEALVEAENAVQLMTIHRAKGLEFPVVIIPDASRLPRESSELLYCDRGAGITVAMRDERGNPVEPAAHRLFKWDAQRRDQAEEKRLLYVAATRAQEYLMISGRTKPHDASYLGQILNALDGTTRLEWGTILVRGPNTAFVPSAFVPPLPPARETVEAEPVEPSLYELPLMTRPLSSPSTRTLKTFSSTWLQLAVKDPTQFDQVVIQGAPDRILPVRRPSAAEHAPAVLVGDIAHQALRRWRLPASTPNLQAILEGYAVERGCADPGEIQAIAREARVLLSKFENDDLFKEMDQAIVLRHEVPFVVPWQGRSVHGVLDALYQSPSGRWFIVDFKTDRLGQAQGDPRAYTLDHYGVQLALYQSAASAHWGQIPVRVHYLRDGTTVDLYPSTFTEFLNRAAQAVARPSF